MKIKKHLLLGLSFLVMAGCASSPESRDSSYDDSGRDGDTSSAVSSKSERVEASPVQEPVKSTTPPTSSENQALIDAMRANNDEAIARSAQTVLSKNSTDLRALNALGMYHYKKGHLKAADYFFGRAIKANPRAGEVYNNMGLVLLAEGERNEAIKQFKKAIEMNSGEGSAAANLGAIYLEEKDYAKALIAMEIAYRKNSKDVKILNNYAVALTAQQKFSEARDMYKKAQSANPNDKDVLLNYAILLVNHLGKLSDGQDLINKLKFLGPSAEARNVINGLENKVKAGLNK